MWIPTNRAQHSRAGRRNGSDATNAEWRILSPFLPPPPLCGCPRKWERREIVNAIFYVLRGSIAWSLLPRTARRGPIPIAGSSDSATTATWSGSNIIW